MVADDDDRDRHDAANGLEAFRSRFREWLTENAPRFVDEQRTDREAGRAFRRELWDAGFLAITLDRTYGGQGLGSEYEAVVNEEMAGYVLPPLGDVVTTGICAPTLLDIGSEEQRRRHIPRMIRGDEVWTQLLSEPGAGSDLAGLQTKAVRDGSEYVITGQKVWTSGAVESDFALCIVRTNPDVPKHQGLSMFIVSLRADGVTIRPLRQMTGESHFNEVFLDEVRVAESDLVGTENDGWRALTTMLTHERLALGAGTGTSGGGRGWTESSSGRLIELARRGGLDKDPVVRQELVQLYIGEAVLGYLGQKLRADTAAGVAVGPMGSVAKLASALISRQSASLGMRLAGPESLAWDAANSEGGTLARALCSSPMTAIVGGTSEIQRNTIGERVLGLPREPRLDRDVPFRDVFRNTPTDSPQP